jgi:hypothetical protein
MLLLEHLSLKEPLCASFSIQIEALECAPPLQQLQYAWPALYLTPLLSLKKKKSANIWKILASVDLDECIESLYKKNLLAESVIEAICAKTKELLMQESNVVHVQAPVTVVGDIHGQFYDLIEIFKIGGWCPDTNYLFLGVPLSFN